MWYTRGEKTAVVATRATAAITTLGGASEHDPEGTGFLLGEVAPRPASLPFGASLPLHPADAHASAAEPAIVPRPAPIDHHGRRAPPTTEGS
ncbi:MAG TPA: hypothetical protein VKY90_19495 [Candidatus Dormibacteraeota bacterium]|nr:hypothetical protein [Candidatus Dormibacteraeota bacterium]